MTDSAILSTCRLTGGDLQRFEPTLERREAQRLKQQAGDPPFHVSSRMSQRGVCERAASERGVWFKL